MVYKAQVGFDEDDDAALFVEIKTDYGTALRYLDEEELEGLKAVVEEWLTTHRPLFDICACGANLDSRQQCEREEECPESEDYEGDDEEEEEAMEVCEQCGRPVSEKPLVGEEQCRC